MDIIKEYPFNNDVPTDIDSKLTYDPLSYGITFNDDQVYPAIPCNLPLQEIKTVIDWSITILVGYDVSVEYVNGSVIINTTSKYETISYHSESIWWFDPCTNTTGSSRFEDHNVDLRRSGTITGYNLFKPNEEVPIPESEEIKNTPINKKEVAFYSPLVVTMINAAFDEGPLIWFKENQKDYDAQNAKYEFHNGSHKDWFIDDGIVEQPITIPKFYWGVLRQGYRLFIYTALDYQRYQLSKEKNASDVILEDGDYTLVRRAK